MTKLVTKEELIKINEELKKDNEEWESANRTRLAAFSKILGAGSHREAYSRVEKYDVFTWTEIAFKIGELVGRLDNLSALEYDARSTANEVHRVLDEAYHLRAKLMNMGVKIPGEMDRLDDLSRQLPPRH